MSRSKLRSLPPFLPRLQDTWVEPMHWKLHLFGVTRVLLSPPILSVWLAVVVDLAAVIV
jgi:hypothetical protein